MKLLQHDNGLYPNAHDEGWLTTSYFENIAFASCGNFNGTQGSRKAVRGSFRRTPQSYLPSVKGCKRAVKVEKRALNVTGALFKMAEPTGLEPATSDVTGRRSNQLNYDSAVKTYYFKSLVGTEGFEPPTSTL